MSGSTAGASFVLIFIFHFAKKKVTPFTGSLLLCIGFVGKGGDNDPERRNNLPYPRLVISSCTVLSLLYWFTQSANCGKQSKRNPRTRRTYLELLRILTVTGDIIVSVLAIVA